jgi:hypothetical protein
MVENIPLLSSGQRFALRYLDEGALAGSDGVGDPTMVSPSTLAFAFAWVSYRVLWPRATAPVGKAKIIRDERDAANGGLMAAAPFLREYASEMMLLRKRESQLRDDRVIRLTYTADFVPDLGAVGFFERQTPTAAISGGWSAQRIRDKRLAWTFDRP